LEFDASFGVYASSQLVNLIIVVKFERAFDALEGTIKYPIQGTVLKRCHISVLAQF
jgi:hypothetical protein